MNSPEGSRIITIASCLDVPTEGETFMMWPPHVTIVPPFEADSEELHDIGSTLQLMANTTDEFSITGGRQALFEGDSAVRLLEDSRPFQKLHEDVLYRVETNTGRPVNSKYIRDRYQPHVTYKKHQGGLDHGETRTIRGIDIVERDPERGNLKIILAHYAFTGWKRLD